MREDRHGWWKALAQASLQSNGSNDPPPPHAISLHVRPKSALIWSDIVAPDEFRLSPPKSVVWTNGFDQTTLRSAEEIRPSASDPTSQLSDFPCNKSGAFASSATLLLLTQLQVCCIHQLNPQPKPAADSSQAAAAKLTLNRSLLARTRPNSDPP